MLVSRQIIDLRRDFVVMNFAGDRDSRVYLHKSIHRIIQSKFFCNSSCVLWFSYLAKRGRVSEWKQSTLVTSPIYVPWLNDAVSVAVLP